MGGDVDKPLRQKPYVAEARTTACGAQSGRSRNRRRQLGADIVAKIENRTIQKIRQGGFLDASTAATLCSADAKVRGLFVRNNEVPHIATYETHQRSQEISFVTQKDFCNNICRVRTSAMTNFVPNWGTIGLK